MEARMIKKITLQDWAEINFEKPPAAKTLRRWARDCWIFPIPEKRGRAYYVDPEARFIGADHNKITHHGSKAA
jgi:hypothetical protein